MGEPAATGAPVGPAASFRATPRYGRLVAWLIFVAFLAVLAFASNALVDGAEKGRAAQPDDSFYRYSLGIAGVISYAVILGILLVIARGIPRREAFGLYRPGSWPRTLGLVVAVFVATYILIVLTSMAIGPGNQPDQGMPTYWDGSRAGQFALNFVFVAMVGPIVEELMFRGLGFSLLSSLGSRIALITTAILFGPLHGFLIALPIFVIVGFALGWLRYRTGSVYPGMVMHGVFNTVAIILAISLG